MFSSGRELLSRGKKQTCTVTVAGAPRQQSLYQLCEIATSGSVRDADEDVGGRVGERWAWGGGGGDILRLLESSWHFTTTHSTPPSR